MDFPRQKPHQAAYALSCAELLNGDYRSRFANAGLDVEERGGACIARIPYFNDVISLEVPKCLFKSIGGGVVTLVTKIIILHYINKASGRPLYMEKVAYEDIPGLRHYLPVFTRRVVKPLQAAFGFNTHAFREAGDALGGVPEDFGHASFTLSILPRLPVTFILWEGDYEFPPSARILYDRSVPDYLTLEDITVVTRLAVSRIIKAANRLYADEGTDPFE